ncbi:MAG TPA: hypothetical protein V6C65_23195 [Allocoleopsis sp.]
MSWLNEIQKKMPKLLEHPVFDGYNVCRLGLMIPLFQLYLVKVIYSDWKDMRKKLRLKELNNQLKTTADRLRKEGDITNANLMDQVNNYIDNI